MKSFLLTTLLFLIYNNLFAHAIWIETSLTGKTGQSQDVKIYYGEYADNERDSVSNWYSDVKELTVWLTDPDNQQSKLTCKSQANHLLTSFTPVNEGVYTLTVTHDVKDFPASTRYQFNASTSIIVGKSIKINTTINNNIRQNFYIKAISNDKKYSSVKVIAMHNGKAVPHTKISVAAPTGWVKNYETDENGLLEFEPIWSGYYIFEIMQTENITGEHHGKIFDAVWKNSTCFLEIKK